MDEPASRLLDDSNISQFQVHPGRRHSQQGIENALHLVPVTPPRVHKDLPQLPQLIFNNDSAWAQAFRPATTSDGDANATEFSSDEQATYPRVTQPSQKRRSTMLRQKSSRRSTRERRKSRPVDLARSRLSRNQNPQNPAKKFAISSPIPLESGVGLMVSTPIRQSEIGVGYAQMSINDMNTSSVYSTTSEEISPVPAPSSGNIAQDIQGKIEGMRKFTEALKGPSPQSGSGDTQGGPVVLPSRTKLLFKKVKKAFGRSSNSKRDHDPIRDDHLLNDSFTPDDEEAGRNTLSSVETRANEGMSFSTESEPTKLITLH